MSHVWFALKGGSPVKVLRRFLRSVSELRSRRSDARTKNVLNRAAAMIDSLNKANASFQPSLFWQELATQNISMIRAVGIDNFKRTLSQNYFNFPVEGPHDLQMRTLIAAWAKAPDVSPLAAELRGDAKLSGLYGTSFLRSEFAARSYTFFVGLLWSYATREDSENLSNGIGEPQIGNPVPISLHGRWISQDLANSLREYRRMRPFLKATPADSRPILAEIGAGYGRLGYLARSMQPCRYWVFDIPPALAVSEWYLERTDASAKIFRWREFSAWADVEADVMSADIAFFLIDQLDLVPPDTVRAFATISALHEMLPKQMYMMLALMGRVTTGAIYTKNHTKWHNERDSFLFESTLVKAPQGWEVQFDRSDDVLPVFTEKLFTRGAGREN
jgi:putative sugar O-methyltransferase